MHRPTSSDCNKIAISILEYITGWWLSLPLPKNMKVSWDDYSQYMGKKNMFQTTNQIRIKPQGVDDHSLP